MADSKILQGSLANNPAAQSVRTALKGNPLNRAAELYAQMQKGQPVGMTNEPMQQPEEESGDLTPAQAEARALAMQGGKPMAAPNAPDAGAGAVPAQGDMQALQQQYAPSRKLSDLSPSELAQLQEIYAEQARQGR